ncbi:MAG: glutamate-1-semialdehyde 2,1-aminomutase [Pseudomonadales bacterium]
MQRPKSEALFERAKEKIPGGVNSPVRAFSGVGGSPVFFARGDGAYLWDEDGNRYIDYVGSWGPMIMGHGFEPVVSAVQEQAASAIGFGAPTMLEIQLAEEICARVPSMHQVRMVNSGTEATMSAIRLARGYTGRSMILKFNGCYHGHSDSLLVKAGSGVLTLGIPNSPGVPEGVAANTLSIPFNDAQALSEAFKSFGEQLACVIIEPIAGNMGCILPKAGHLQSLRKLCDEHGTVLIFDEVMTGFRVARGGAQELYGITPDLTTLGKVIGAGLPVGAFGGKAEIMNHLAPSGPVYQAGTLSGNPLAMAAGLALLNTLTPQVYAQLEARTQALVSGMQQLAEQQQLPMQFANVCGMFGLFFSEQAVSTFDEVAACDIERFRKFFHLMLERGVYLAPSAFEAGFVSGAHSEEVIDHTLNAFSDSLSALTQA